MKASTKRILTTILDNIRYANELLGKSNNHDNARVIAAEELLEGVEKVLQSIIDTN